MARRSKIDDPSSEQLETSRELVETAQKRRIVVSPDDVFQDEPGQFRPVSLEGVVLRYVLVSAGIIGVLILAGVIWLALQG